MVLKGKLKGVSVGGSDKGCWKETWKVSGGQGGWSATGSRGIQMGKDGCRCGAGHVQGSTGSEPQIS